jgi:hypothetical protein
MSQMTVLEGNRAVNADPDGATLAWENACCAKLDQGDPAQGVNKFGGLQPVVVGARG